MYLVNCKVKGIAPLMQHRFPMPDFSDMGKGGKKQTGEKDYTQEWKNYLYVNSSGEVYQPSIHFEAAMTKAAANFKITGRKGKTYRDLFSGNIFVSPDEILHGVEAPDSLDTDGDKRLYLDMRPAVVQRSRIVRIRPTFKPGWELEFSIQVIDDQIPDNVLLDVLTLAGRTLGVGDHRPKFGRFQVVHFEVEK